MYPEIRAEMLGPWGAGSSRTRALRQANGYEVLHMVEKPEQQPPADVIPPAGVAWLALPPRPADGPPPAGVAWLG
jgi:hypothetical protein